MSGFTAPLASSPPATPDSRQRQHFAHFTGSSIPNVPPNYESSPQHPLGSFTPAGPPPSIPFGSSQLGAFGTDRQVDARIFASATDGARHDERNPFGSLPKFAPQNVALDRNGLGDAVPAGWRAPSADRSHAELASDGDEYDEYEEEEFEDEAFDHDQSPSQQMHTSDAQPALDSVSQSVFDAVVAAEPIVDLLSFSRGSMRSYAGGEIELSSEPVPAANAGDLGLSTISRIACDFADKTKTATLDEPDEIILGTEELVERMNRPAGLDSSADSPVDKLQFGSSALLKLWQSQTSLQERSSGISGGSVNRSELKTSLTAFEKATAVASLLLPLHDPPPLEASNAFPPARVSNRVGFAQKFKAQTRGKSLPIPKVLLDWQERYHPMNADAYANLRDHRPNPAHHAYFWNITLGLAMRGKLDEVIGLLQQADFRHAQYPAGDGIGQSHIPERRLAGVKTFIGQTIQILEQCPSLAHGDWDILGRRWSRYRKILLLATTKLRILAGEPELDQNSLATLPFTAEHFGIPSRSANGPSLKKATVHAESKIPVPIYHSVKTLFAVLAGNATEMMTVAQDWVQASLGLTVWWDGSEEGSSPRSRRVGNFPGQSAHGRAPDSRALYEDRLAWSLDRATNRSFDGTFPIDTASSLELAEASALSGDVEVVLAILRGWSLVVASTVRRIAAVGGWLPWPGEDLLDAFDQGGLMVLSYNQPKKKFDPDDVLLDYAERLYDRGRLRCPGDVGDWWAAGGGKGVCEREGWELSTRVLLRLDDPDLAQRKTGEFLDRLSLDSESRVEKMLQVCENAQLNTQGARIAEQYADLLTESSSAYGDMVRYYAFGHHREKVTAVLNLLVSFSLIQSAAYPPASELDPRLRQLIESPQQALWEVSQRDVQAAEILQSQFSGYATVRAYYDLRDQDMHPAAPSTPRLREGPKKRQALVLLLTLIQNAADSIHGGLYDRSRTSPIAVECLLSLLGEAMVFVNHPKRLVSLAQAFELLKAIEDLQAAPHRLYTLAEDLFHAVVSGGERRSDAPSSGARLKQSTSSLTGSSAAFSFLGGSMLGSAVASGALDASGVFAVKPDLERGWDWREGLPPDVSARDLLQMLRLALATELSRAWLSTDGRERPDA
ncbi:MAG: hypothetical protein M1826_004476 [Phylliscum demangeonii]|nr:MAG: hypothetical protein M1826_004476 [Phylliscum demangeonii]